MKIHHLGLLTSDIHSSKRALESLGYRETAEANDDLQGAHLKMFEQYTSAPRIELVKPFDTNLPLKKLLKHKSDHMYHVCIEADTIDLAERNLKSISDGKIIKLSEEKPAILFGGRLVCFFLCPGLGLVEVLAS